jgi:hypothetical protein
MKSRSFRVVPGQLIPRKPWYKRALLASAAIILAGCGGSAHGKPVAVRGHGFSFNAPAGWKVTSATASTTASQDDNLLQVSTFPLIHPYTDALFTKVKSELDVRMHAVAKDAGGTVTGSKTVTVAGGRAHSYDVTAGKDVLEYTFVLRGKKEYELLCRRPSSDSDTNCAQLLTSFAA